MTSTDKARALARLVHRGQKYGRDDYVERHVAEVARRVHRDPRSLTAHVIVAWLHDTVEDTPVTFDDLRDFGFSSFIVSAVDAITRRDGEDYLADYIPRVKKNEVACLVKRHDLIANSNADTPDDLFRRNQSALDLLEI